MKRSPSLSGSRIAITGAARGIGLATARALTAEGAAVALGDLDGDLAAEEAARLPGAVGLAVDVSDRESFRRFLDSAETQLGPIDALVNNAGVMHLGRFLDHDEPRIRRMIDVNLLGALNGMQLVLPRMVESGRGHVVNVASTAGKVGAGGGSVYAATKHAVVGLSEAVRAEVRGSSVRVSVVMPGPVNTELGGGIAKSVRGVGVIEPEQVAAAVVRALRTGRFEVFVPGTAGIFLRLLPILPRRLRDALERFLGIHDTLAQADSSARAAYEARVASAGAESH